MIPTTRSRGGNPPPISRRRNPPRARNPRPRADDPVTYVLPASTSETGSDNEAQSAYEISDDDNTAPTGGDINDNSDIEVLDGPPVLSNALVPDFGHESHYVPTEDVPGTDPGPDDEEDALMLDLSNFVPDPMYRVNTEFFCQLEGHDYIEQVNLLIEEIHRLRPESSAAAVPETISPVNVVEERLEDDLTLFFIGVQVPQGRRVFVQSLCTAAPDHTLFERLSAEIPILGRALRNIEDCAKFYIGTTRVPVDIPGDYMNHVYGFRELGSWAEAETNENLFLSLATPAPASQQRTALLTAQGLDDNVPLYILYIYHEITTHSHFRKPRLSGMLRLLWRLHCLFLPVVPAPPITNATSSSGRRAAGHVDPACSAYLRAQFGNRLALIQKAGYGTAYRHCMQEKHFMAICNTLGLNLNLRQFVPVAIPGGPETSYDDVVLAAGLNPNTFAGTRTTVAKARDARRRLARYKSAAERGEHRLEENKHSQFLKFLPVLDAMLRESDIDDSYLTDTTGSPEAEALAYRVEEFKASLAEVLGTLL
ncbi:hypothetical protein DFH07DRAFT_777984 [Mycena maculata]|uniref:Uncharacterized protein n=1 Tax=Mycena maculata TaxID=230809 RepID=A0AAD7N115_9AGAR|nr:hypothetical protein DFH07DRAFT_777984 [Mycena maculata]